MKKQLKKLMAAMLALTLVMALTSCGAKKEEDPANKVWEIGICQLVQHPALDAATQGFIDAVTAGLGAENVNFNNQNGAGDGAVCATICNTFVSDGVDLIMANATPAMLAAQSATNQIPILATSITDYASALGIDDWNGTCGGNISGTSDLAPLDLQAQLLKEVFPDAQTVGLVYCSGEPNSVFQAMSIEGFLKSMGLKTEHHTFTSSNDIALVVQNACDSSDVIYIPTDNTAAACTEAVNSVASVAGVPIIAGEEGICAGCGVATLSISYYDIGWMTGEMAVDILKNGKDISTMPVQTAPTAVKKYNPVLADLFGLEFGSDFEAIE